MFLRSINHASRMRVFTQQAALVRSMSLARDNLHFRNSAHAVDFKSVDQISEAELANKFGRQQNHIWTLDELKEKTSVTYHYSPKKISDYFMWGVLRMMYHSFNWVSGYKKENPSVRSIEWRLIVLESVAGVPGFVAAGFRHFRSLRRIEKDYGFIEETATETYIGIIKAIETPGTHLNLAWKDMPAPDMAKGYWKLPADAKWVDTMKCICADETHHRDVNHTYASLQDGFMNPYLDKHRADAEKAWNLHTSGKTAWPMKITDVTTPVPTPVTTPPLIVVPVVPNNTTDAHVKVSAA